MKIAHLIPQFYPYFGGAEVCIHNVCESLVRAGHQPIVITTTPPPKVKAPFKYDTIHLSKWTGGLFRRAPFLGKIYLRNRLAALQKKYGFDLWQVTMGYPAGIYSVDFFKKNKIPCILRCCGDDIQKYPQINYGCRLDPAIDALAMEKYPKFDGLVALTPSVKKEYLELGIDENKIRIIPNGVDVERFAASKNGSVKEKVFSELGMKNTDKLILTVGRYHPKKGYELIPAIAAELKKKGFKFTWVVAGKAAGLINTKFPEARSLGIVTMEKFAGLQSDFFSLPSQGLVDLYCAANIFVLPTLIETFGMVLVEAMAAGLPIVTTEAPGVTDVISNGVNGLKVPVGDTEAMAEAIANIFNDRELRSTLSSTALKEAENKYDWKSVTARYLEFYEDVLSSYKNGDLK
ncbi:MAG: hypothetical protein A2020_06285 [Lentisphaerae bacterium GWF2_45_14]|nr:MAG: hypothetical protein A2020_06285 [Lentisphaerae bacterium GWF2_45_14]